MESSEENSKSAVKIIRENACMNAVKPVNATENCSHNATEDKAFFQANGLKRIKRQSLNSLIMTEDRLDREESAYFYIRNLGVIIMSLW